MCCWVLLLQACSVAQPSWIEAPLVDRAAILEKVTGTGLYRDISRHIFDRHAAAKTALETLETLDHRLRDMGVTLHLSEVKGPVMDRLQGTDFLRHLSGRVFLTHHQAVQALQAP